VERQGKYMKKLTKETIKLASVIAPIIGSRDLVNSLEKTISKSKADSIELDFQKVNFASRSAAHALLNMKEDFLRKTPTHAKKEISFVNVNEDIETMLRTVAANRALPKKKEIEFAPERVSIKSLAICKSC
jgi:anti-anti-sigma regulatory factor